MNCHLIRPWIITFLQILGALSIVILDQRSQGLEMYMGLTMYFFQRYVYHQQGRRSES